MNMLQELKQVFSPAQFKRDFATDKILIPSKAQRYLLNTVVAVASSLMTFSLLMQWWEVAWFSSVFLCMVVCKYLVLAYHYIQNKVSGQK